MEPWQRVCRICLFNDNIHMYSLKKRNLPRIYKKLNNGEFNAKDGKPKYVCYFCHHVLLKLHFITEMDENYVQLRNGYSRRGIMKSLKVIIDVITRVSPNLSRSMNSQVNLDSEEEQIP